MISQPSFMFFIILCNTFIALYIGYISMDWNSNQKQLTETVTRLREMTRFLPSIQQTYDQTAKVWQQFDGFVKTMQKVEQTEKDLLTFNEILQSSLTQVEEILGSFFEKSLEFDVVHKNLVEVFTHYQHVFEKIASLPTADDILKLAAILDVHLAIAQMRLGMDQSPDSTMAQLLLITQQIAELKGQDNVRLAKNASAFHSALLKMRDDKKLRDLVNKALLQTIEVT